MKQGEAKKVNTRGWAKVTLASTQRSTLRIMRKKFDQCWKKWSGDQECMWEIVVRMPPKFREDKGFEI